MFSYCLWKVITAGKILLNCPPWCLWDSEASYYNIIYDDIWLTNQYLDMDFTDLLLQNILGADCLDNGVICQEDLNNVSLLHYSTTEDKKMFQLLAIMSTECLEIFP